jgi:hypothetical protein
MVSSYRSLIRALVYALRLVGKGVHRLLYLPRAMGDVLG